MLKKMIFVYALTSLFSMQGAFDPSKILDKRDEYMSLIIHAVHNLSRQKTSIGDTRRQEIVPEASKSLLLQGFKIPFVSLGSHSMEYARRIPFAPTKALRITTQLGLFRIWQNEQGVICVPDPREHELGSEWAMKTLLKCDKSEQLSLIKLLLFIGKRGDIHLKRLRTTSPLP